MFFLRCALFFVFFFISPSSSLSVDEDIRRTKETKKELLLPISFEERAEFPVQVEVTLIGDGSDGQILTSELENVLDSVLSHYLPHYASEVEFQLSYQVIAAKGREVLQAYKSMFTISDSASDYHVLSASTLSNFIENLRNDSEMMPRTNNDHSGATFRSFPVWIILPNSFLPEHRILSQNTDSCFHSYIGHVLFVDLSASCDMNKYSGESLAGSSTDNTWRDSRLQRGNTYLLARLSNIVTSAVKQFVTSAISFKSTHAVGKILCPIIILSSRGEISQSSKVVSHKTLSQEQLSFLSSWVESLLLPGQEAHVFSTTHYVEDHPQLSLALSAATRSAPVSSEPNNSSHSAYPKEFVYLDSKRFLSELSKTGDSLCQRLLLDAGHGLEDDLLLEVEALFSSFRKRPKEESKLERWVKDNDPLNYVRAPEDELLSHRYSAVKERTKIVPVFVLSDLFELEAYVDEKNQLIYTQVPLFDSHDLVSFRENLAIAMHSTAHNTIVLQPNLKAYGWSEVNISDPAPLIAEALAGSLSSLSSPHIRTSHHVQSSEAFKASAEADFAWSLGDHPFYPYSEMDSKIVTPRFSNVISWASRRGAILSRANSLMHRLHRAFDRAVIFMKDVNRVLSLFFEVLDDEDLPSEVANSAQDFDDITTDGVQYHNEEIETLLSKVFLFNVRDIVDNHGDSHHIENLASHLEGFRSLVRTILQRVLDIKAIIRDESSNILQTIELMEQVENEILDFKEMLSDRERSILDVFGSCDFSSKHEVDKAQSSRSMLRSLGIGKTIIIVSVFLLLVFIMKKIQDRVEMKAKKID